VVAERRDSGVCVDVAGTQTVTTVSGDRRLQTLHVELGRATGRVAAWMRGSSAAAALLVPGEPLRSCGSRRRVETGRVYVTVNTAQYTVNADVATTESTVDDRREQTTDAAAARGRVNKTRYSETTTAARLVYVGRLMLLMMMSRYDVI